MIILPSLQIISDKFPGKLSNTECYITRENIDYSDRTGMVGFFCFVLVLFFFFSRVFHTLFLFYIHLRVLEIHVYIFVSVTELCLTTFIVVEHIHQNTA